MAELWQPTRRMYVDIIGGELDGLTIDSDKSPPVEKHLWALIEGLETGKALNTVNLLSALSLAQNYRQRMNPLRMTEEYTVVVREETDHELLIQLRHRYLPQG